MTVAATVASEASMLNPVTLFMEADIVVQAIMIGLAIASLWSWAVIIDKAMRFNALNSQANAFEDAVGSGRSLEDVAAQAGPNPLHPLPRMLLIALTDWREARTRGPLTENQANLLMSRIDRVVSKEELRTQVFANTDEQVQADAVEVVVHRLRKKLVGTNAEIVTLRGVGYLLCDADSMAAQKGDKVDKAEKGGALR